MRDVNVKRPPVPATGVGRRVDGSPNRPSARRSNPETPSNLPRPLTSFIGRRTEIAAAGRLVLEHRLVTLVGAGGIGKSRLANEVAQRALAEFPGGVWHAELAGLSAGDNLASFVGDALGVRDRAEVDPFDALVAFLRDRPTLLVLDECEVVAQALAMLISRVLAACANLHILATSRQPLRVSGEVTYDVPTLAIGAGPTRPVDPRQRDAVELFVDRLQAIRPEFRIDARSLPIVRELCVRVDGLPLAIELTAARARHFELEDLLPGLDDQMALLSHGARDVSSRHRSLEATVDWSVGLLGQEARELYPRLAVFRGGFDLEGADAMRPPPIERPTREVLSELVDQSLVLSFAGVRGATRYRMLEPIRQHALQLLRARGGETDALERHAHHFARVIRRWTATPGWSESPRQLDMIDAELENLRVALAWAPPHDHATAAGLAANLGFYWCRRGRFTEGRTWLGRSVAVAPDPTIRARGMVALAWLMSANGEDAEAREMAELSLPLVGADPVSRVRALELLSLYAHPDAERVRSILREAIQVGEAAGMRELTCGTLAMSADAEWLLGERRTAVQLASRAVAIARSLGNAGLLAVPLGVLAREATFAHRSDAETLWSECLAASRELGDPLMVNFCLAFQALRASWSGDTAGAADLLAEAASTVRGVTAQMDRLHLIEHVGLLLLRAGRETDGLRLLDAKEALGAGLCCDSAEWTQHVRSEVTAARERTSGVGPGSSDLPPIRTIVDALEQSEYWVRVVQSESTAARRQFDAGPSRRELEVARLIAAGMTNREIGQRLLISERTVEAHIQHIMNKLSVANRAEIAAWITREDRERASPRRG